MLCFTILVDISWKTTACVINGMFLSTVVAELALIYLFLVGFVECTIKHDAALTRR